LHLQCLGKLQYP